MYKAGRLFIACQRTMKDCEALQYWIPPHVRVCAAINGTVILNLKRSRYVSIGIEETRALLALDACNGMANMVTPSALKPMTRASAACMGPALVQAGLLSCEATSLELSSRLAVDMRDTLTAAQYALAATLPCRAADVLRFVRACLWAKQATRREMFDVACEIAYVPPASSGVDLGEVTARTRQFRRLRPFAFAAQNRCLFHALALWKFLSQYHLRTTWVIGVRLRPWSAHSWVQCGNLLLDADIEHVYQYTPILAV